MKRTIGIIELFITAVIWGAAFVAQSVGMDYLGPLSFNGIRYAIGAIVLIPVILIIRSQNTKSGRPNGDIKTSIKGGIFCGMALCTASLFQQYGILYTTVGKAGFVTALYIIIVPFIGVLLHQKIGAKAWIAAVVAIIGFYLMCMSGTLSLQLGDMLVLIGAFVWSIHIHTIDHFAGNADGVIMSSVQFAFSAIVCMIGASIFETITIDAIINCAIPLLYAGCMSCGIAYTLQIVGQKHVEPTLACMILSLESVVSALAGWILLGESMRTIELFGCVLVFAGIIIAQLPSKATEA